MVRHLHSFADRHIGPNPDEVRTMLDVIGVDTVEELINQTIPEGIRLGRELDLPPAASEPEVIDELTDIARSNRVVRSLIGMGYHGTITPPVIQRNVLENPAWYTAYTPYQPEISQGRLEALLNFQTMVAELTGLDIANASLLDEGTALAEAVTMAHRVAGGDRSTVVLDPECHPQSIAVVETRLDPLGLKVVIADPSTADLDDVFAVVVQQPGTFGRIADVGSIARRAEEHESVTIVAADLLSLAIIEAPGAVGADICVGTSQRFGVPMGYGGPHAAYIATREAYVRALPGRLVGVSVDDAGRQAYRLTLQTREQHIRRERATSNVCTAQVLLAVMASFYAVYHGPDGIRHIASEVHRLTGMAAAALASSGVEIRNDTFFDTLVVVVPGRADAVMGAALDRGFNLRRIDGDHVGVSFDETCDEDVVAAVVGAIIGDGEGVDGGTPAEGIPSELRRTSPPLVHPIFDTHHSEHELLRYIRRLSDMDLALDRTMIPLGSCTMKLNATTEMVPITWPQFASLHPFVPADQAAGYRRLIDDLERWLAEITGYDAVSLQPNAGAQGELAGLLAIRAWHHANGDPQRTVCLIPSSAHGTNAASAVMAGMKVVVVACDEEGNVDVDDLAAKIAANEDTLAALMVTYPSTHGVFESAIVEICKKVHDAGGQVYVDGANLNALVGTSRPADFGADVSHLNLHKTFTIPHGGGGPGVGPIGVRSHLAPFLPNHPVVDGAGPVTGVGPISAAPWGSAGILPIPWTYIRLMGPLGLLRATETAILSANYMAARLHDAFPVLYRGASGRVAHECIVDVRPLQKETGVTAEDVAKRLADFGFHAPTLSFPVAGTLMIEPTESESLVELDRFCDAMLAIRSEIAAVKDGRWSIEESPLRHAPHTVEDVTGDWDRAYSRAEAMYPVDGLAGRSYFPPVSRIDGVYGDRNLQCSCPPVSAYGD